MAEIPTLELLHGRQQETARTLLRLYKELERLGRQLGSGLVNGHDLIKLADAIIDYRVRGDDG